MPLRVKLARERRRRRPRNRSYDPVGVTVRPAKAITRRRLALNVTMDQVHVIAGHIHVIADHIQRDRGSHSRHRGSHSRDHRSRSTPPPVACTRSGDVFLRRPITLHVIADRMRATGRHIHTMGHPTHAIADLTHARRPHVQRDHRSRACDRRSHSSDETTTRTRSLISRTRTSSEWTGDPTGGGGRECEAKRKACPAAGGSFLVDSGGRPSRRFQAAVRRREITSPRLQAGEEAATDTSPR